LKYSAVRIGRN